MICPMTSPGFLPVLPVRQQRVERMPPASRQVRRRHPHRLLRPVVTCRAHRHARQCGAGEPSCRSRGGRLLPRAVRMARPDRQNPPVGAILAGFAGRTALRPRRARGVRPHAFGRSCSSAVSAFVSRALQNRFPAPALQDFGHAPAGVAGQCAGGVARLPEPSGRRSSPPTRILAGPPYSDRSWSFEMVTVSGRFSPVLRTSVPRSTRSC